MQMAEGATGFGGDVRKIRRNMEANAIRDENRENDLAERSELDAARRSEVDREKRIAQIEGEPGDKYNIRMQNQAWNPDAYGKKYRDQFGPKEQQGSVLDSGLDDEAVARRRRRMSMATAFSE
jgi:hypothetical protein